MAANTFKNYAFISYQRKDEKWAKWLQHKLEHYRFPVTMRRYNIDLPEFIRPVFRDTSDLSSGYLESNINNALDSSKFLIVICSENSASSPWVSKEVQHFVDTGKESQIIPFIVHGTPNSNDDSKECLVDSLKRLTGERELLGINIAEMGPEAAAVKVVSYMFNVEFDILWRRHERERKSRNIRNIFLGCLLLFVITISLSIYLHQKNNIFESKTNIVSNEAINLESKGDFLKAQKILLDFIINNKLITSTIPGNIEFALRNSVLHKSCILNGHENSVLYSDFSYNGKLVATSSKDKTVRIWNTNNGECIKKLDGFNSDVQFGFFSPNDSLIITITNDRILKVWSLYDDTIISSIYFDGIIYDASFSPDGKKIVVAPNNNYFYILSTSDWNVIRKSEKQEGKLCSISFSPEGGILMSASENGLINFTDVSEGNNLWTIQTRPHLNFAKFGRCGKVLTYSSDDLMEYHLELWDLYSGTYLGELDIQNSNINCACFHPDLGLIAVATDRGYLYLYSYSCDNNPAILIGQKRVHESDIFSISFSKDGRLITTSSADHTSKIYDYMSGLFEYRHYGTVRDIMMSRTAGLDIHDTVFVNSARFSPDGNYFVTAGFTLNSFKQPIEYVQIWDANNDTLIRTICDENSDGYEYAEFSHNMDYVAACSRDSLIRIWGLKEPTVLKILKGHEDVVESISFHRNDTILLSASNDGIIKIWDAVNERCLSSFIGHSDGINSISFSPDYNHFVTASKDGTVKIWRFDNHDCTQTFNGHKTEVSGAVFSPDGRMIASCDDKAKIILWDASTGSIIKEMILEDKSHTITDINFSHDGHYLASSSTDNSVRVWKVADGELIYHFLVDIFPYSVSFSSDDSKIVVGAWGFDNNITLWKFKQLDEILQDIKIRFTDQ